MYWVTTDFPKGIANLKPVKAFKEATIIFVGVIIHVLNDKLVGTYLHMCDSKEPWDALEAKFGATDADIELYVMEKFMTLK